MVTPTKSPLWAQRAYASVPDEAQPLRTRSLLTDAIAALPAPSDRDENGRPVNLMGTDVPLDYLTAGKTGDPNRLNRAALATVKGACARVKAKRNDAGEVCDFRAYLNGTVISVIRTA